MASQRLANEAAMIEEDARREEAVLYLSIHLAEMADPRRPHYEGFVGQPDGYSSASRTAHIRRDEDIAAILSGYRPN